MADKSCQINPHHNQSLLSAQKSTSTKEKGKSSKSSKFCPKIENICQKLQKFAQKLAHNYPLRTFFDNQLRTFFDILKQRHTPSKTHTKASPASHLPKIILSKKSVCPSVKKSARHKKGPSIWAYPSPLCQPMSAFAKPLSSCVVSFNNTCLYQKDQKTTKKIQLIKIANI